MLSDDDKRKILVLTRAEIADELVAQGVPVSSLQRRDKEALLHQLYLQPENIVHSILTIAEAKLSARGPTTPATRRKRRTEQQQERRTEKRRRPNPDDRVDALPFLTLPSKEDLDRCHRRFLHATSNDEIKRRVCVSCARELPKSLIAEECFLDTLKHRDRLIPATPHPAHETIDSMLLATEHVTTVNGQKKGWFCKECLRAINSNRLPPLSLANRMWIGPIPPELARLTVPEQILISLYHPRCYVYKLHPRNLWSDSSNPTTLQNGLKGNVTTYELNMPDIIQMLEGKLMPRPTSILASMIAVSFIGPGRLPKTWLKKTFRVRRQAVLEAILCLKSTTRHPGYVDMDISHEALARLPEDDVPIEILASIQHEPDVEKAQREAESYLHPENGVDAGKNNNTQIL